MMKQATWMWMGAIALGLGCSLPAAAQDQAEVAPDETASEAADTSQNAEDESTPRHADSLSDRMGQWSQHAMAARLAGELSALLHDDGLLLEEGSALMRDELMDVATRCDLLARSADESAAKRTLYETQARSYNALAQDAIATGHTVEGARQLRQLRSTAARLGQMQGPNSRTIGAYWEMVADLIDANRTIGSPRERHLFARELLSRFIEISEEQEQPPGDYAIDARLALARMLDQVGDQHGAAHVLGPLGEIRTDTPRYAEAARVFEHLAKIGRPIEIDLPMAGDLHWRSQQHTGRQVLIHVYAAGIGPSAEMIKTLRNHALAQARDGGFDIVSIRVGLGTVAVGDEVFPPWPTALADPAQVGVRELLDRLGVESVPAFIWLDEQARLAALGQTLEVLEHRPLRESHEEEAGITGEKDPTAPPSAQDENER